MTASQRQKAFIKERIRQSNEAVLNGGDPDPWVIEFRNKNNKIKSQWKSRQPKTIPKQKVANAGSFKPGQIPHNVLPETKRQESLKRWRKGTKEWHKKNRERINTKTRVKRQSDAGFRIKCNLRKRLSFLVRLHSTRKSNQTMALLGCDIEYFMNFLKLKFTEGMSFDNYGLWHIDHIIPCDKFDLTDVEQQKICFNYTNMQPLWALDNRIKSNK